MLKQIKDNTKARLARATIFPKELLAASFILASMSLYYLTSEKRAGYFGRALNSCYHKEPLFGPLAYMQGSPLMENDKGSKGKKARGMEGQMLSSRSDRQIAMVLLENSQIVNCINI